MKEAIGARADNDKLSLNTNEATPPPDLRHDFEGCSHGFWRVIPEPSASQTMSLVETQQNPPRRAGLSSCALFGYSTLACRALLCRGGPAKIPASPKPVHHYVM